LTNNNVSTQDFLLFQVDLVKHTNWLLKNEQQTIHIAKKDFGTRIIEKAGEYDFCRLFWAGDGGIFYGTIENRPNYDVIIELADSVYVLFERWKEDYSKLNTQDLDIRVSAHVAKIITDRDSAFWTSLELNKFRKLESDITVNGFAISQQVKDHLTEQNQNRFDWHTWHAIEYGRVDIWYDSMHKSSKRLAKEKGQS
jgi:hypothetical protein